MKIETKNGQLFINGKEVEFVVFKDFTKMDFPTKDANDYAINGDGLTQADIFGSGNAIVQNSKNVVTGTIITAGSFRLGDG